MPGKLVYFISIILILVLFMGFNLENRCNISIIFFVFKGVPIFFSMLFSFLLGTLSVVPFLIGSKQKKEKKTAMYPNAETVELKEEKRSWFGKKKNKKASDIEVLSQINE